MTVEHATWLCPDDEARARVLDNSPRVRRARTIASLGVGAAAIYAAPHDFMVLVPLFLVSMVNTSTVDARMQRSRRPEYQAAFTVLLSQALLAAAGAVTGGPRSPILALIVVPTAFVATRFRPRVCFVATGVAIGMLLLTTLAIDPTQTIHHPAGVVTALGLLIGVDAATQALFAAELQHRHSAVLDPLTGLLNRHGLEGRFQELAEQARLMGAPVSLLICDIDHFKQINDHHGHATGDGVLRDVALTLRSELRSFELAYRFGGEEFLIVLPGASAPEAAALAQRLCEAIRERPLRELPVTISVGVATQTGDTLHFGDLFEAADRALYEAKASGRDQVVAASAPAANLRAAA